jgi:hypothetical protein
LRPLNDFHEIYRLDKISSLILQTKISAAYAGLEIFIRIIQRLRFVSLCLPLATFSLPLTRRRT